MSQEQPSDRLGRALDALALGSLLPNGLASLSDLGTTALPVFEAAWAKLPEKTRVDAIRAFIDLAAARFEINSHPVLESAIRHDPSPVVRQLAVDGSYERSDADFVDLLLSLIGSDPSIDVRASATAGLANFCDIAVFGLDEGIEERAPEIRKCLVGLIDDPGEHPAVHAGALTSIAAFGSDEFISNAIENAYESADERLKTASLIAMGRTNDRRWLGELLAELKSEDVEIRRTAAYALGRLGEADAVVSLGAVARDPDRDVRAAAIWAIGELGGGAGINVLSRLRQRAKGDERKLIDDALAEARLFEGLDEFDPDAPDDDPW